eukprot:5062886-Alexandrium_andersonii.AAC.1
MGIGGRLDGRQGLEEGGEEELMPQCEACLTGETEVKEGQWIPAIPRSHVDGMGRVRDKKTEANRQGEGSSMM